MKNQDNRRRIAHIASSLALACGLSFASTSSQAAETGTMALASTAVTGVGQWIAAQGNTALREMGDELRRELRHQLQPLLPPVEQKLAQAAEPAQQPGQ